MNDINDMNGTNKYTSMLCNSIQAAVSQRRIARNDKGRV